MFTGLLGGEASEMPIWYRSLPELKRDASPESMSVLHFTKVGIL
jgi:hypothetical protein